MKFDMNWGFLFLIFFFFWSHNDDTKSRRHGYIYEDMDCVHCPFNVATGFAGAGWEICDMGFLISSSGFPFMFCLML